jgi:hypothetical protein
VYEGARLQLQNQEIVFQSIQKRFLNKLGDHLLRNFRRYLEELIIERAEDLVLITGVGTTSNWEADAVVMEERSFALGGGAALPTMIGVSGEVGSSHAQLRNPGFSTGHMHQESTNHRVLRSNDVRQTIPESTSEHNLRFPLRQPFQYCCTLGRECPQFKKQYVFVQTVRIRSKEFLGLERIKVETSASGLGYTRWKPSRKLRSLPVFAQRKSGRGPVDTPSQPVVDKLEGPEGVGDCVCSILQHRVSIDAANFNIYPLGHFL